MKRIKRIIRLTRSRNLWESMAELGGWGLLVTAVALVNEVAGIAAAGLVLLNYAYGRVIGGRG